MIVGVVGLLGLFFLMNWWMLVRLHDEDPGLDSSLLIANSSRVSVKVSARCSIWRWAFNPTTCLKETGIALVFKLSSEGKKKLVSMKSLKIMINMVAIYIKKLK